MAELKHTKPFPTLNNIHVVSYTPVKLEEL